MVVSPGGAIGWSRLVDLDSDRKQQQQLELPVTWRFVEFLPQSCGIDTRAVVQEFEVISRHRQPLPHLNPVQMPAFRIHGDIVLSRAGVT